MSHRAWWTKPRSALLIAGRSVSPPFWRLQNRTPRFRQPACVRSSRGLTIGIYCIPKPRFVSMSARETYEKYRKQPDAAFGQFSASMLTCLSSKAARLWSDSATSGCSGPRVFSCMANDCSRSGSASAYFPCAKRRGVAERFTEVRLEP